MNAIAIEIFFSGHLSPATRFDEWKAIYALTTLSLFKFTSLTKYASDALTILTIPLVKTATTSPLVKTLIATTPSWLCRLLGLNLSIT